MAWWSADLVVQNTLNLELILLSRLLHTHPSWPQMNEIAIMTILLASLLITFFAGRLR